MHLKALGRKITPQRARIRELRRAIYAERKQGNVPPELERVDLFQRSRHATALLPTHLDLIRAWNSLDPEAWAVAVSRAEIIVPDVESRFTW